MNMPQAKKGLFFKRRHASPPFRIVIAGGGTGGHLFPGIAIAQEFKACDPGTRILFVGTGRELELKVVAAAGFDHRVIRVKGLKGRGLWRQAGALARLPWAVFCSMAILRRFRADLVIGVGGYSAGPVVAAARLMGIKTAIHEQNLLPGITNRVLARFAHRIYVSFESTKHILKSDRLKLTGNPVRRELIEPAAAGAGDEGGQPPDDRFTVLILGGSQGAHSINMAVIEALDHLGPGRDFDFIHQTGGADAETVAEAYRQHGVTALVAPFFQDMARPYARAELVICRAGATTVAELTALGKAVVFVPYPHAADDHQVLNARSLADRGAADIILEKELSAEKMARTIERYAGNRELRLEMARRAGQSGRPDAARDIVSDCYRMLMPSGQPRAHGAPEQGMPRAERNRHHVP